MEKKKMSVKVEGFKVSEQFEALRAALPAIKDQVKKINGIITFNITNDDNKKESFTINAKAETPTIELGAPENTECTINIGDEDCLQILGGKTSPMQLFMDGRVALDGNMQLAMKLNVLTKIKAKL
mmetsp:Transcript_8562/g.12621  ORF Transcript_8562/g.12621 Transcript_8562/m.12621 type:complete len:126 (+) Transcript_8562:2-379(+)